MKRLFVFILSGSLLLSYLLGRQVRIIKILSPDEKVQVQFKLAEGKAFYRIYFKNKKVIDWSGLGFRFKDQKPLNKNLEILAVDNKIINKRWEQVWGANKVITNHYQQNRINLQELGSGRRLDLIFRVYDNGVGFRYILPEQQKHNQIQIISEDTEFKLENIEKCWWIPAHYDSYELLYNTTSLNEMDSVNTPVTMRTKNGLYLSLHEADLTDYAGMTLVQKNGDGVLHSDLVPWPDGIKVKAELPLKTPWRTIQIAEKPGGLIESNLILNLNRPNQIKDTEWIKPMKYVGIWWGMHIDKYTWSSGPKHGATTENAQIYIDFANKAFNSDSQEVGLLVEGWNLGWDGDWTQNGHKFSFTESYPDFELDEVLDYCHKNNVAYIMHNENGGDILNYGSQIEEAFDYYQKLGIHAIKSGYVAMTGIKNPPGQHHHGQYMVNHYRRVVKLAAEHEIMLDVHEPIKPTGIRRTWPNMMTREGARGMEYNAWSAGNPPEHSTIIPFTRVLAGPMDYTPGIFDLTFDKYKKGFRTYTTLAKQLAFFVVIYSPLQMAADLVENYENQPGFQFIKEVPVDWDETRVIDSKIGDYVIIARRAGQEWFIGGITDEHPRKINIHLDFLSPEKYKVKIYCDAINTGLFENPGALEIGTYQVKNSDIIQAPLSTSGGLAARLTPIKAANDSLSLKPICRFNKMSEQKLQRFRTFKIYTSVTK